MRLRRYPAFASAALGLILGACGGPADDEAQPAAAETAIPVEPDGGIGDGATPPSAAPSPSAADRIPAAVQGRWGLTPADCTSARGDAKGLLTVSPTTLTFYESVGRLGTVTDRADDRIRATFAFTGEGMEWSRDLALAVQQDGRTLVRREYGPEASPGAFEYTRCS